MASVPHSIGKLIVTQGPSPGQEYDLVKDEVIIGRESGVDIIIPSPVVSRRHTRFIRQRDRYLIEDLGSSNGTFLNGQRLTGASPLTPGDRIGLGQAIILTFETSSGISGDRAGRLAETVLGEDLNLPQPSSPPQLVVTIAGQPPQSFTLIKERLSIGRAEDNDIVIPVPIISRHHAFIEHVDSRYQLSLLPDATNPLYFEGRPLQAPRVLHHRDTLRIGGHDPGMMVSLTYNSPGEAVAETARPISFGENTHIQIGRDLSNDVILDSPQISRFHAQIERIGKRHRVRDLRSSNGTFVNDQRIAGEVWLKPDDTIRIGPHRFIVGENQLLQYNETHGLQVDAVGLHKWVRKDLNLLQNISLSFQPREFIVVVGQSGVGKTTLVDAIAGYRPATQGKVQVNGIDVYRNFDAIRNDIGYVPQRDIIHMELTVYQALDYAAQLRMPPDTTKSERHKRVMEVLEDLDLLERKDVQISGLSGGQQKRVSIGVELLTKPGLFFLDEPTSGLDPGTETAFMQLMRRLADQGRTIVLITHATKNVMLADKVVFLARGGYLAWFGPPDESLRYFDRYRSDQERRAKEIEFDEIYAILDDPGKGGPQEWQQRFLQHPAFQKYVLQPLQDKILQASQSAKVPVVKQSRQKARQISSLRQFLVLSSRNLKILTRDRFSLVLMLAVAPLVGLLDVVLSLALGSNPFSQLDGNIADVITTLFILTVYGVLVGALSQMREIVKEQDIYKRERLVNLRIFPYVLSKVWVAALLAFYQAAAYVIIRKFAFDMPGGLSEYIMIYITLVIVTLAGMMLGLFASALSPNANAAPLFVILLILPQMILNGALIPLPSTISGLTATHWAFSALMGISGVGSDVAADICWSLDEDVREAMTLEDKANNNCKCMGTNILDPGSCNFPGMGKFYNPAIDQPPPVQPALLGDPPPEPALPERPVEPVDQADTIAMSEYFDQLKVWENDVQGIQDNYKREVAAYQSRADVFEAEMAVYQEDLAKWNIARAASVEPAESVLGLSVTNIGWSFVDKENPSAFRSHIAFAWIAQLIMIAILMVAILILQKSKDAR